MEDLTPVQRLSRDLANAAATLTPDEVRFLTDSYYQMQKDRIRAANQVRALEEQKEPHLVLSWLTDQSAVLEGQIRRALQKYAEASPVGSWCLGITGIGPVITAGLLAHIDITRAPTVGHIWRFGGVDPTSKWEKGEKRPWNASLKRLFWIIGESFVKVQNLPNDVYGKVYAQRKVLEQASNEAGKYAEQAAALLKRVPNHAQKAIYATGKLSDGHIHARAKRYATKLFLAHLHETMYLEHFKMKPPLPWPIQFLPEHTHVIPRPT